MLLNSDRVMQFHEKFCFNNYNNLPFGFPSHKNVQPSKLYGRNFLKQKDSTSCRGQKDTFYKGQKDTFCMGQKDTFYKGQKDTFYKGQKDTLKTLS